MNDNFSPEQKPVESTEKDRSLTWALILVGAGILTSFIPWFILEKLETSWFRIHLKEYEGFGQFLAGVTTPFFTLAAFILLYKTYQSQKEQLRVQKEGTSCSEARAS